MTKNLKQVVIEKVMFYFVQNNVHEIFKTTWEQDRLRMRTRVHQFN